MINISAPEARVLIVDDSIANRKFLKSLLEGTKIQIDSVSSGPEAIDFLRRNTYDIVFLDIMMPRMSGPEILWNIEREELVSEDTAIIALSTNDYEDAGEQYRARGFTDYLPKPVKVDALVDVLKKYLHSWS